MSVNLLDMAINPSCVSQRACVAKSVGNNGDYVILLHGYLFGAWTMGGICNFLDEHNFTVLNCSYSSEEHSINTLSFKLKDFVRRYCIDQKKKIHFVVYSQGVMIASEFVLNNPSLNFGKVVMISPHLNESSWKSIFSFSNPLRFKFNETRTNGSYRLEDLNKIVDLLIIKAKYCFHIKKYKIPKNIKSKEINCFCLFLLWEKKLFQIILNFITS